MEALIGKIEKAKPFFEKVSRNKYLKLLFCKWVVSSNSLREML